MLYVWVAIILIVVIAVFLGGNLPKEYRDRKCMGRKWKRSFPDSSKTEIRKFLLIFADAFLFSPSDKLKFEPDDCIYQIYKSKYLIKNAPDTLELEIFALSLDQEYGFDIESIWSETLSLGQVYAAIKKT